MAITGDFTRSGSIKHLVMRKLILLILAGLYTLNPYDILPDLLVGWGWLDDLIIWILLLKFVLLRKQKFAQNQRFHDRAGDSNKGGYSNRRHAGPGAQEAEDTASWDPHRILGVDRSATTEEIKHAYRELANKYHPDKLEHLGDEFKSLAEKRFKEIQQAYQELSGKGG